MSLTIQPSFSLQKSRQQEEFSIAYIHAVAAAAGFGIENVRIDMDSIDLYIKQYRCKNPHQVPVLDLLGIQIKCTYAHNPNGNFLRYPLPVNNYEDLSQPSLNPRILVVLNVPKNVDHWIKENNSSIVLQKCAYWVSLEGKPQKNNKGTITVQLPTQQRFTTTALKDIMARLAVGGRP